MKKSVKNAVMVLLGSVLLLSATANCADPNSKANSLDITTEPMEIAATKASGSSEEPREVHFKKGKLIEVAFLSIKEGKQQQLNEEYFAQVMPIAQEYGMKPLMKIGVKKAMSEDIQPQLVGFFEWPSAAKKEAFDKDKRFQKLKKIRDDALSYLRLGFYEVAEDMSVNLDGNLFYEVYAMSLNKEKGHLMQNYFEKAGPICQNDYGVDFALSMTPVKVKTKGEHFQAQSFGLAIWKSEQSNQDYFRSKEYAAIKHYKEQALERLDVWQGAVILQ